MCSFDLVFQILYGYILHKGLPSCAIPPRYDFFLMATKFGLGGAPQGSMASVSRYFRPEMLELVSCEPGHVPQSPMCIHWFGRVWIRNNCQLYGGKVPCFDMVIDFLYILGGSDCPNELKNKHCPILWFPWVITMYDMTLSFDNPWLSCVSAGI